MKRVTPARPINPDRITIRWEYILDGWAWVVYSPQRLPDSRCERVRVEGTPMYRTWFYSWDFAWLKLDRWHRSDR